MSLYVVNIHMHVHVHVYVPLCRVALTSGEGCRREGGLAGDPLPNLEEEAEVSVWEERDATFSRCTGV